MNRSLQQSKIMRLAKTSRNRFTFDGANHLETDEIDSRILNFISSPYYYKLKFFLKGVTKIMPVVKVIVVVKVLVVVVVEKENVGDEAAKK